MARTIARSRPSRRGFAAARGDLDARLTAQLGCDPLGPGRPEVAIARPPDDERRRRDGVERGAVLARGPVELEDRPLRAVVEVPQDRVGVLA
jgi:hypothetical protein